jgi:hypothetical protein
MPIGKFKDFAALKGALLSRADKRLKDPDAYTAAVARKIEPGFDAESAKTRRDNAMERAATARVANRRTR